MKYSFDEVIDRKGSGCVKYDNPEVPQGVTPMWVADMDFRTPDFILDALRTRLDHPVLGYPHVPDNYFNIISSWVSSIHSWKTDPSWMCFVPGIVRGIGMVINAFCSKGDKIIVQPPVYHPFRLVPQRNGYEVVSNPLIPVYDGSGTLKTYRMDFDSLERLASDPSARIMILSNPHNPCGIAWDADTLRTLAEICKRNGVLIISDEIHSEMMLWGGRHIPFQSVCNDASSNSICFMSPSKTFNIPGVVSSYAIVPEGDIRSRFFSYLEANEFDYPPVFSYIATVAAYTKGGDWRKQMLAYVEGNLKFLESYLAEHIPYIGCTKPQASFLAWLDCRKLDMTQENLMAMFSREARVFMNDGTMFGDEGAGFVRMNVACPRCVIEAALERIENAVNKHIA